MTNKKEELIKQTMVKILDLLLKDKKFSPIETMIILGNVTANLAEIISEDNKLPVAQILNSIFDISKACELSNKEDGAEIISSSINESTIN